LSGGSAGGTTGDGELSGGLVTVRRERFVNF
jgi:hypothetical protein